MKATVSTLAPGDVILPPPREVRLWIRRRLTEEGLPESAMHMTILSVREGTPDKGGPWTVIKAAPSPLWAGMPWTFKARPDSPWVVISKAAPAPVAPPAGKYVPAVGDVCRYVNDRDGSTFVITLVDADGVRWKRTGADNAFQVLSTWPEDIRFVRDSTDAEKRAAGLAVPPPATAGDKRTTGLYEKFRVERTDGKSAPGQKHEGCRYFVLDVTHDPLAPPALRAYAASARAAGYGPLADDLDAMAWKATPPTAPTTPAPEAKRDGYDALTDAEGRDLVEAIDRTKAERAAFDKDDAPEARRPTWVKVTRKRDSASTFWTVGKVYPVVSWDCGDPRCVSDDGSDKYIRTYEWEPCDAPAPCPPPVAGRGERPEIVCLCGSTRFMDAYAEHYGRLTDEGKIVLSVGRVVPQSEQALGSPRKAMLDELHLRKIDLADRIFVLNVGGYIGSSTKREIEYARAHGKPVTWLESPGSAS